MPYQFPARPPQESLDYFRAKRLTPSFDHRDVYREEHGYAFTVAKVMQLDVLEVIHNAVDQALAEGRTFQQFKKDLTPLLQKLGWWGQQVVTDPLTGEEVLARLGSPRRLKTIYRVNMRTARAAGQWDRIERSRETHPYLLYELGPSREHRDQHVRWAGILLPSDDPWWQTHFPPNGWGCKCRVRQVSQREAERLKATGRHLTDAPPIGAREWTNKRTGEVLEVPDGIDPGFDINAGIARQTHIQNLITNKLNSANPDLAAATARELVNGPAFTLFLKNPKGNYPVAALDGDLKTRLSASQNAVILSDQTLAKQRRHHPELTDTEYRLLPDVVNRGLVVAQGDQRLVFFHREGRIYKAVVKATQDGKELYLVTFHRTDDERELEREKSRGRVVREELK